MDRMEPKWIEWAELDRSGLNQTEVYKMDRIEPMWTERPNRTKMD